MKKLLLIAIASFLSIGACAQANTQPTPYYYAAKGLNCTEEAISLKINIPSGRQGYSPRIGNVNMDFIPSGTFATKRDLPAMALPANFKKAFSLNTKSLSMNNVSMQKIAWLRMLTNAHTDKFTYTVYDYSRFLLPADSNIIIPSINYNL